MRQLTSEGRITVFKSFAVSKVSSCFSLQWVQKGRYKNLRNEITSIQCSWVKRLSEDDFHDWKVIPLFLIGKHLGKNFKFHNNID